jgi:putative ABC transport system permease protein
MRLTGDRMKTECRRPPGIFRWLLHRLSYYQEQYCVAGDLEEIFQEKCEEKGYLPATLWFICQTLLCFPRYFEHKIHWRLVMLKNYLKIAFRVFQKQKIYSLINVTGLALGLGACILLFVWVSFELRHDAMHSKGNRIYCVNFNYDRYNVSNIDVSPGPLAPLARERIPGIVHAARVADRPRQVFRQGSRSFYEDGGAIVDLAFFKMFDFQFIRGSVEEAFSRPNDMVLTESLAERYFQGKDPVGEVITVEGEPVRITGVIRDVPPNSFFQFRYASGFQFIDSLSNYGTGWGSFNFLTFVLLESGRGLDGIEREMTAIAMDQNCPQVKDGAYFTLQPFMDMYLHAKGYRGPIVTQGNASLIYGFTIIALFILLIACINFTNLSTARSSIRLKEVGLRKTLGASRKQLAQQFLGESALLVLISLGAALLLAYLMLPVLRNLSGKPLNIELFNPPTAAAIAGILIVTILLGGSYPAFYLSSFHPAKVLKDNSARGGTKQRFRNVLVVFQFVISVFLIIATLVASRQIHFLQSKELGFDRNNLIYFPIKDKIGERYQTVKTELLKSSRIQSVAAADYLLALSTNRTGSFEWEGKDSDADVDIIFQGVDRDFFRTMDLDFSEENLGDQEMLAERTLIVNETAVREMGMADPLGKEMWVSNFRGRIGGVIRDVHFKSLHQKIHSYLFYFRQDFSRATQLGVVLVRLSGEDIPGAIDHIRGVWKAVNPAMPFEYHFLDQTYNHFYQRELRVLKLLGYFTMLSIFISCLGLFGLASFAAERRTKEIGIRKVLGAHTSGLMLLLCREYARWVLAGIAVAYPLAYFVSNRVLADYAYRIRLTLDIFLLASLLAIVITVVTVSTQAFRTARSNPVQTLRYE